MSFEAYEFGDLNSAADPVEHPYGAMLGERVLQELLKTGWAKLKADPDLVDQLLFKLDDNARKDVKDWISNTPVSVTLEIPVGDQAKLPFITVMNTSDVEDEQHDTLGYFLSGDPSAAPGALGELRGHAVISTWSLYCCAPKDSNASLWLYYLSKALVLLNVDELGRHGLHGVTFPSGRAVQLNPELFPERTFARVLDVKATNFFSIRVDERVIGSLTIRLFSKQTGLTKIQLNTEQ